LKILGEHVIINEVFEFPPKDSWSILVNLESLYGIWEAFGSVNALITCPKAVRLLLIFCASVNPTPTTPVLSILSDPARSTK